MFGLDLYLKRGWCSMPVCTRETRSCISPLARGVMTLFVHRWQRDTELSKCPGQRGANTRRSMFSASHRETCRHALNIAGELLNSPSSRKARELETFALRRKGDFEDNERGGLKTEKDEGGRTYRSMRAISVTSLSPSVLVVPPMTRRHHHSCHRSCITTRQHRGRRDDIPAAFSFSFFSVIRSRIQWRCSCWCRCGR